MKVISRKEAKERGLKLYYTGIPCKYGHVSEKYVSTCSCCECHKRSYEDNRHEFVSRSREYRKENKEKISEYKDRYRRDNLGLFCSYSAKYRASKLRAIPDNLPETYLKEIDLFYQIARWYDEPMHVDHIVPLQGENVCGLHVPWNLQLLTVEENLVKSNKLSSP